MFLVDNVAHFNPLLSPSTASNPVQSGTMTMAQDLGGPPALSGVGAPLVSPPSDARARPLLPAPYLAVSPATGDSVCRDTGPESYCLDGSMLASTAPPPRPPFQLSPSAPTFYPSSSRTPVEQVLHPPSCVYYPQVPAACDSVLPRPSAVTSHISPCVQSLPPLVVPCQPPPPPDPPDPLPPSDPPDPPLYQTGLPPRSSPHPPPTVVMQCDASETRVKNPDVELPEHVSILFLQTVENSNLPSEVTRDLKTLLNEPSSTFAKNSSDLGYCDILEHDIDTGEARPIKQSPRRPPLAATAAEDQILDEMLETVVIQPS